MDKAVFISRLREIALFFKGRLQILRKKGERNGMFLFPMKLEMFSSMILNSND